MKFIALCALAGLGMMVQQSEAALLSTNPFDSLNSLQLNTGSNPLFSTESSQPFNLGQQTQQNNNFGLLSLFQQPTQTQTQPLQTQTQQIQNPFSQFSQLNQQQQIQQPIQTIQSTQQNQFNPLNQFNTQNFNQQTIQGSLVRDPKNPNSIFDFTKLGIFDNFKQELCYSPRIWDGTKCVCPNNQVFISGKCYQEAPTIPTNNLPVNNQNFPVQPNRNPNDVSNDILYLKSINRNFDGTENNVNNPHWGAKGAELLRICPPNYQDQKSKIWSNMPNPRDVSNLVGQIEYPIKESSLGLNMLFTTWGQFLIHDLSLSPTTEKDAAEPINIPIPRCDKFMDKNCTGTQEMGITRSTHTSAQVRTNINVLTAWLDASMIYGSDKIKADSLREFKNGKMKTSPGNLLPKNQKGQTQAGDTRSDENSGLTAFHTIFVREHNRLCDIILNKNPNLSDEEVFQTARNYIIGLVQHITFDEYLPELIGKQNLDQLVGPYKYDPNACPNIFTEFSAAGFRIGHSSINSPFRKIDNNGSVVQTISLAEMFFNPSLITNDTLAQFLNGMSRTSEKERSLELVDDVRNFLFALPNTTLKVDLFAFNVQRGRDHGICSIKQARQRLGLSAKSIRQIFQSQESAKALESSYQDLNNVDLWLGIIGQKKVSNSVLGELGIRMNAFQFQKIRNGDRFWYEKAYPESIVREIKSTTFGDIIRRNSGATYVNPVSFKKF